MLEVIIVLLVFAVLAAIVVPQALTYIRQYRLGIAARNVATALQRARYLATSNNKRTGIVITEGNRILIEQYDPAGEKEPENKGTVHLADETSIAADAPKRIAFDGRGIVTPLPKESPMIRVNGAKGYYMVVMVSPTGQVTLSETRRDEGA